MTYSIPTIHKKIFAIAAPIMVSSISTPLLGIVDSAVMGHMPNSSYLAGIALGSMLISVIFWLCNFIRMSSTGLIAQAYGRNEPDEILTLLIQAIFIALFTSLIILLLYQPILTLLFPFIQSSEHTALYAQEYFNIRIFSAPAVLTNFALFGYFIGVQNGKTPMVLLIITNVINIVLNILFVFGFDWGVPGVAWASLIADYLALLLGLYFVSPILIVFFKHINVRKTIKQILEIAKLKKFLLLGRDIFFRSLLLQAVFIFMTLQGVKLGDNIASANAVLLNFFLVFAFALDGLAYAAESLVGKEVGRRNEKDLHSTVKIVMSFAGVMSIALIVLFTFLGEWFIAQITTLH